jgi:hypothetical protein
LIPSAAGTTDSSLGSTTVAELRLTENRPWYSSVTMDSNRYVSPSSSAGRPALAHVTNLRRPDSSPSRPTWAIFLLRGSQSSTTSATTSIHWSASLTSPSIDRSKTEDRFE